MPDLSEAEPGLRRENEVPATRPARLSAEARRSLILAEAAAFFSEHGFAARTRALADACGIAQRLLYRHFPSKKALVEEVYDKEILGPFKVVWLATLEDRSIPVETRLTAFYIDYFETVLTRKWLRLFMFSSLAQADMAPSYIQSIIKRLLRTVVDEVAAEKGLALPADEALVHEIGWVLHGAVSHFAIRRHLYSASDRVPAAQVLALHIRSFLDGFEGLAQASGGIAERSVKVVD